MGLEKESYKNSEATHLGVLLSVSLILLLITLAKTPVVLYGDCSDPSFKFVGVY